LLLLLLCSKADIHFIVRGGWKADEVEQPVDRSCG